jgi:microcystin-dependent protein
VSATTVNGNGTIPIGGIIIWSGSATALPTGWAICDGTNGTPNLTGRFVLGYQSGTYNVGATGGSSNVTLAPINLPPHEHTYSSNTANGNPNSDSVGVVNGGIGTVANVTNSSTTLSTGSVILDSTGAPVGGPAAFSIMPPYYVLAYIMRRT